MQSDVTHAHCNRCGSSTKHDIIAAERQENADEETGITSCDLYEMLRRRGCDSVSMRDTWRSSEDSPPTVRQYPPPVARRMPGWADWWADLLGTPVPTPICDLMFEVYTAVQANSRRLAAMGIRATLDAVMVDKVGDQVTFKDTADAFEKAGYLSVRQRGHLDAILEAGHAAIHRGWEPTDDDIITLLDIAESIIETAYLHEQAAKTLDGKVPPRPPRPGRVAR